MRRVCSDHEKFLVVFEDDQEGPPSLPSCPVCRDYALARQQVEDMNRTILEMNDRLEMMLIENQALDEALKSAAPSP